MKNEKGIFKVTYLQVKMDPLKDESDLFNELSKLKEFDFSYYSPKEGQSIEQTREWLAKIGLTEAFYGQQYYEDIGRVGQRPSDIVPILHKYLDKVITVKKLTILDRYIFPSKHDNNYSAFFMSVIEKYLPSLDELTIISSPKHNEKIKNEILQLLKSKKPTLNVKISLSDLFHDRLWISDFNSRGLILGTSLNGFGKKYALIDFLNSNDVKVIVKELTSHNLI